MNRIVGKIIGPLGIVGVLLWYLLGIALTIAPLAVIRMPWYADVAFIILVFSYRGFIADLILLLGYLLATPRLGSASMQCVIFFWVSFAIYIGTTWLPFLIAFIMRSRKSNFDDE